MVDDEEINIPPPREDSEMIEDSNDENRPPPRLMITKMVRHLCFVSIDDFAAIIV